MKARVKATDRIIEVMCVMNTEGAAVWEDISGISTTPNQYTSDELEFLDFPEIPIASHTPNYWDRLKHTYAGMAMQGILANQDLIMSICRKNDPDRPIRETICELAEACAQTLVEKMKEEK